MRVKSIAKDAAITYRVQLTRARQSMVIFIPHGDNNDGTRLQKYYDKTYEYLKTIGIKEI